MVRPCLAPGPWQPPPPADGHVRPGTKGHARAPWLVGARECVLVRALGPGARRELGRAWRQGQPVWWEFGPISQTSRVRARPVCGLGRSVPLQGLLPSACSFLLLLPDVRLFPRLGLVSRAQSPAGSQACRVMPRPARRTGGEVGTVQTSPGAPAAVQARRTDSSPCSVPTGLTGDTGFSH